MFPNAYKGVKKLYSAEILSLIATILSIISAVLLIVGAVMLDSKSSDEAAGGVLAIIGLVVIIGSGVLLVLAFIFNLIGLIKAKKDENSFRIALYFTLLGIILSCFVSTFSSKEILSSIFSSASSLASLLTTIFIVQGIMTLAAKLENDAMVQRGGFILKVIICVEVLALIASVISVIFRFNAAQVIAGVLLLVSGVLNIIAYFIYLNYLSKAKKMLKPEEQAEAQE